MRPSRRSGLHGISCSAGIYVISDMVCDCGSFTS